MPKISFYMTNKFSKMAMIDSTDTSLFDDLWYSKVYKYLNKGRKSESEVTQLCPTLCDPTDCSLLGFSIHGIFQARVLEWIAISFSRESSLPRDWTRVSHIVGRFFYRLSQGSLLKAGNVYLFVGHLLWPTFPTSFKTCSNKPLFISCNQF